MLLSLEHLQQLIPLQVVLPLIAAPLCVLFGNKQVSWSIATIVTWGAFAIAILLFYQVHYHGPMRYAMGNWLPPVGIELKVNAVNSYILILVSAIGSVLMPFAYKSIQKELDEHKHAAFYATYLLCFTGLLGITITNDAFNIYVFLEISSLATYTLIALGTQRKALLAGFEYLILGSIGATFYLIGIGLLYMVTGTLNITDLAERIQLIEENRIVIASFAFIVIGLALKIALFPLHLWLCNAYTYAPSFVSAFLSATATKVSLYVLITYMYVVFGIAFTFGNLPVTTILMTLAVFAILTGSLVAIYQTDVKRMLAYSSVAQIGYIILGISLATQAGLNAGLIHMFNHALIKAGLFLACGCVIYRMASTELTQFQGLGKIMPYTMSAFVICGLGLIGVPFTAGFISKWQLLTALIAQDLWLLVIIVIIGSFMAIMYMWKIIEMAYFQDPPAHATQSAITEAPFIMRLSLWVCALAVIYFGIDTRYTLEAVSHASTTLLGGHL